MLHMVVWINTITGVKHLVPCGQGLSVEAANKLIKDIEEKQQTPHKVLYETIPYEPGKKADVIAAKGILV